MDISDYITTQAPEGLQEFDIERHILLVDDFVDALRPSFLRAPDPAILEFITLDYDILRITSLVAQEPSTLLLSLIVTLPAGRFIPVNHRIAGVQNGELWFCE